MPVSIGVLVFGSALLCGMAICSSVSALPLSDQRMRMVSIPAGRFKRDDGKSVQVQSFSISACEITKAEWDTVRAWAIGRGYDFAKGSGSGDYPVANITWYDAVKFCNAASEMAGRTPIYYTDKSHRHIYRSGEKNISSGCAEWNANGYRLPSEAEWEYACRAGTKTRYYWGETSNAGPDNKYAWHTVASAEDINPHEVGLLKPNAFGLYDMSGNVFEWCWDWAHRPYNPTDLNNPKGPDNGIWRVMRGGSVALDSDVGSGVRSFTYPFYQLYETGLRIASTSTKGSGTLFADHPADKSLNIPVTKNSVSFNPQRFFSLVDLKHPGLERVRQLVTAKEWDKALEAFRDYFIGKLRANPDVQPPTSSDEDTAMMMALHGRFPWMKTPDNPNIKTETMMLSRAAGLLGLWRETKNRAYLDQWFYIAESFSLYDKADFDALSPDGRMLRTFMGVQQTWHWCHGFCGYGGQILNSLTGIAHGLPADDFSSVPPRQLAEILTFCETDDISTTIKDPRSLIPNQLYFVSMWLMNRSRTLSEFRDARAWFEEGKYRFVNGTLTVSVLPDGGDMEQSLNYNTAMPTEVATLVHELSPQYPDWLKKLHNISADRMRLFAALSHPTGGVPALGSAYTEYPPEASDTGAWAKYRTDHYNTALNDMKDYPDPEVSKIIDHLWGKANGPQPSFTSIAFPYSGYYTMRTGWDNKSLYMWLMGARPGSGHACDNINSIALIAYGRHLLVDSGADSYGSLDWIPEDQHSIIKAIDLYRGWSFGHNTVVVDHQSQRRLTVQGESSGTKPYTTPIPCRWHTSDLFDLAEGHYDDGYGNTRDINIHARHHRQVIFIRKSALWIVTDRLTSDAPHTYTQCWNFPPERIDNQNFVSKGFSEAQVLFDTDRQCIRTADPTGANVFLYQYGQAKLDYEKYFGSVDPTYGWFAPWISGRRLPKVDIQTSWQGKRGTSMVVTAIAASQAQSSPVLESSDISKGTVKGCTLKLADGSTFSYLAAPKSTHLQIENIAATASTLLVTADSTGEIHGIALDCTGITINGKQQKLNSTDFEFSIANNHLQITSPIRIPTTFHWIKTTTGFCPRYNK